MAEASSGSRLSPEEAVRIHDRSVVVDGCGVMSLMDPQYVDRFRRGGITCVCHTTGSVALGGDDLRGVIRKVSTLMSRIEEPGSSMRLVTRASDVRAAKSEDRLGVVLYLQDGLPIEDEVTNVDALYRLGIRIIQPVYTNGNLIGSGCGEYGDGGLTFFGHEVVERMNALGILIDISHIGDRTGREIIEQSSAPVIASHAAARAICNLKRNKDDDTMRLIAESGGYVGVMIPSSLVASKQPATIDDVLNHIDYIVELVGPDHVGLGVDSVEAAQDSTAYRETTTYRNSLEWYRRRPDVLGPLSEDGNWLPNPEGLRSVADARNLTVGLANRGYSAADIQKILGENWLRVFASVCGQ